MKYIQHMTCAHDDEKMQRLIDECGMAGYGAYWVIAEVIASQIRTESVSTSIDLSFKSWGHRLHVDPRTARRWIEVMGKTGLAIVEVSANRAMVDMPNLLKYGDEYTKRIGTKSRQTPEPLGTNSDQQAVRTRRKDLSLKTEPVQSVDNSAQLDGANSGDNGLGALSPLAPDVEELGRHLQKKRRELGITT